MLYDVTGQLTRGGRVEIYLKNKLIDKDGQADLVNKEHMTYVGGGAGWIFGT